MLILKQGKLLAEKGTVIDRRMLDRIIPHLENGIGFKTISQVGGVLEDDITLQSIKIYAPNDEGEKEINVIGNAYVEDAS